MTTKSRSPEVDRQIDANLKRAFDEMAGAPIPDRLTELLKELRGTAPGGTDRDAADD